MLALVENNHQKTKKKYFLKRSTSTLFDCQVHNTSQSEPSAVSETRRRTMLQQQPHHKAAWPAGKTIIGVYLAHSKDQPQNIVEIDWSCHSDCLKGIK